MGAAIEDYVVWLTAHDYKERYVWLRVPIVFAFGEFLITVIDSSDNVVHRRRLVGRGRLASCPMNRINP